FWINSSIGAVAHHLYEFWNRRAGTGDASPSMCEASSQRIQKVNQLILLSRGQVAIVVDDSVGFVRMTKDCFVTRVVQTIVHQFVTRADAPKRSRAHLVLHRLVELARVRIDHLSDTVTGANIVQQKITVRVNDLVA